MKPAASRHLRQLIAQQAARMMAEEGLLDYAHAKNKAARQLGVPGDDRCLPSNQEVEQELRLHHELFRAEVQPQHLQRLRSTALDIMRLLEPFRPHLAGAVLDGTAGRHAEIELHLFADSLKDVELFLLNRKIPYVMEERNMRIAQEKRHLPVFVLESQFGPVRLVAFATDDLRLTGRGSRQGEHPVRANTETVAGLLAQGSPPDG